MKELAKKLITLAEQLEIPLILRISFGEKRNFWKPTRQAKKQSAKFLEFAQRFEELITSGTESNKIRETIKIPTLVLTGNFFLGIENTRTAKDFYEKAIFLDRNEASAWNNLGVLLHKTKDPIRALNSIEKAIDLNVNMPAAWFNRGCVLFDLGREKEASECFKKSLELEPENTQSWFLLGMTSFKRGEFQAAIDSFQVAIELQPEFEEALEYLALTFQNIGVLGKSLEMFENLLAINPKRPDILVQMGTIYVKFGIRSQGISCYMKAADLYEEKGLSAKAQIYRNEAERVMQS